VTCLLSLSSDAGTYVRSNSIDELFRSFLEVNHGQRKQIISLGAGSDSRFWRFGTSLPKERAAEIVYHEIDFAPVTAKKIRTINKTPILKQLIEDLDKAQAESSSDGGNPSAGIAIDEDEGTLYSRCYNLHPLDLRELQQEVDENNDSSTSPSAAAIKIPSNFLKLPNISSDLPTLILSECCLIYLPPSVADSVLTYFTSILFPPSKNTPLSVVLYEPTNPLTPFGRQMVSNLLARGIKMPSLARYQTAASQRERLERLGFSSGQGSADMDFLWEKWVTAEEKGRVASLEMLDEVEEWRLLGSQYVTAWAWRGELFDRCWKSALVRQER
jgi:[phosphatase 2A protein]-leucine-carboxy methyltransferase